MFGIYFFPGDDEEDSELIPLEIPSVDGDEDPVDEDHELHGLNLGWPEQDDDYPEDWDD